MSQIHDMPWARAGAPQQVRYLLTKLRHGSEQGSRIEVSLNRRPIADVHPGLVDVGSPINPDDIAARGVQLFQKAADSGAKVNHGSGAGPDALNQRYRIPEWRGRRLAPEWRRSFRAHPPVCRQGVATWSRRYTSAAWFLEMSSKGRLRSCNWPP